ncbi:MAG: hypothetical protein IJR14_02705 [Synergistaceae bacterium]|nr:hypothetical protein [Synergistaceae bacterium]
MERLISVALVALLSCASIAWCAQQEIEVPEPVAAEPPRAQAPTAPMELLEAGGTLEGMDGTTITLAVGGTLYTSPVSGDCTFIGDRGTVMDRSSFVQRYRMRYVTVELEKETGAVVSCRVGS